MGPDSQMENDKPQLYKLKTGVSIPCYVARTFEPVRISKGVQDPRFPDQIWDEVRGFEISMLLKDFLNLCYSLKYNWKGEKDEK